MRIYEFKEGSWDSEEWIYAASKATPYRVEFTQKDSYIKNNPLGNSNRFEYVSMVLKEKFKKNIKAVVEASFEEYGAPLFVFSNDLKTLDNNHVEYGTHFEVVAYEKGINVWHIFVDNDRQKVKKVFSAQFPVKEKEKFLLSMELNGETLTAGIGDISFSVHCDLIPEEFHIGITACEGVNHFYHMKIVD